MQNFVIHWRDGVGRDWLTLTFKLDGSTLGHSSLCVAGQSGQRAGVLTSADIEQPFEFADLHTTGTAHALDPHHHLLTVLKMMTRC